MRTYHKHEQCGHGCTSTDCINARGECVNCYDQYFCPVCGGELPHCACWYEMRMDSQLDELERAK